MTTFADQALEEQISQWRAYVRRRQCLNGPDVEELEGTPARSADGAHRGRSDRG